MAHGRGSVGRDSYVGKFNEVRELIELVRNDKVTSVPVATRPLDDLENGRIVGLALWCRESAGRVARRPGEGTTVGRISNLATT